jgi:hypothetical protein
MNKICENCSCKDNCPISYCTHYYWTRLKELKGDE